MASLPNEWIHATLNWLQQEPTASDWSEFRRSIGEQTIETVASLIDVLASHPQETRESGRRGIILFQTLASVAVAAAQEHNTGNEPRDAAPISPESLREIYSNLSESENAAAAHVMQILAAQADDDSLRELATLLVESPPSDWQSAGIGLSPLWHADRNSLQAFFEFLGDGFYSASVLAVLLDLANHSLRKGVLDSHPFTDQHKELASMLSSLAERLAQLEENPEQFGESVESIQEILAESVAITVSLCDTLGQTGNSTHALPALNKALEISHRRVQTEAAAALARLGDDHGKQRLLALADDRAARRRAVTYAEELNLLNELSEEVRSPLSLAESDLAAWLSLPENFGVAPSSMELVEKRVQYWPSYEEPQDCYLFRYEYQFPGGNISNIGIAGPLQHAFAADLGNLPADDIYAAFAGWQAEHEEIYEVPPAEFNSSQHRASEELCELLADRGFQIIEIVCLAFLLGEVALVCIATTEQDQKVVAVWDTEDSVCFPTNSNQSSMTPEVALCIYRGRKLLRSFNS